MSPPFRLALLHRSLLFRQCLKTVFEKQFSFDTVEVDATAEHLIRALSKCGDCCVVLVDISLPDGQSKQHIQAIREASDRAKVIALVPLSARDRVLESIAAGAHGCVLEEASLDELIEAIRAVSRGDTYCSNQIVGSLFRQVGKLAKFGTPQEALDATRLTPRELEILEFLSKRLSNKEIARKLSVSVFTVKNHVHNILEKLEVETRLEAVEQARQRSWISTN